MSAYLQTINKGTFILPIHATDLPASYSQGMAAGDQAFRLDQNPYPAGTSARQWWDAGWLNSMDETTGTH